MKSETASAILEKSYASGVTVLWSAQADTRALCQSLIERSRKNDIALAIIWFSATKHCAKTIVSTLATDAPKLTFCGCSTSGEVTPEGMQDNGFIVTLLPKRWFDVSIMVLNDIAALGMEAVAQQTTIARNNFLQKLGNPEDKSGMFALNLIDGLSYSEEAVTVAIYRGLEGIPLVGGSAGDDLLFKQTWQITSGSASTNTAVMALIRCRLPCQVFSNNNFMPTEHKLVVTDADPDLRRVNEFNAEPAALAYASAIGMNPDDLDADSFASYSVIVRFGGSYYCRSIQQVNEDQSLTFFCAIDNGMVMTVAQSKGMVASSRNAIDEMEKEIGPIDMMFGFDCIYRKLDARNRQTTHRIASLYKEKNFVGFNTYGEQFHSLHINQTLTGIAIGTPEE